MKKLNYLDSISIASKLVSRFVVRWGVAFFQCTLDIGFDLLTRAIILNAARAGACKVLTFVALDPTK